MYNANTVGTNWFKELAATAVLKNIFNAILHWERDYEVSILGRVYDAFGSYEFADDYKDRPETIRLILDEYKSVILFYVADSRMKPRIWTPEQYWEYLRITVEFIFDEEIIVPCCSPEMWQKYEAKYGDTPIEAIELIIAKSFKAAFYEDEDVYLDKLDTINNKKTFKKACEEMMDICGITRTDERIDMLCEDARELYYCIRDEESGHTLKEAYRNTFGHYFSANMFEEIYMFDVDYLFYFDGYDFVKNGGIDEHISEVVCA